MTADGPSQLAELRARLAPLGTERALGRNLRTAARELAWVVGRRGADDRWGELGISIRAVEMEGASGGRSFRGAREVIEVSRAEPYARQRFTVAHELGHSLLSLVPPGTLEHAQHERLCNEFARELLLPSRELRQWVRTHGGLQDPQGLFQCRQEFNVTVSALLAAMRSAGLPESGLFISARWSGHRERPDVQQFRCRAWAGPAWAFVPPDTRLSSLGLRSVADWASSANHGETQSGSETLVRLPPGRAVRGEGIRTFAGPVQWTAVASGQQRHLLVHLTTSMLEQVRE